MPWPAPGNAGQLSSQRGFIAPRLLLVCMAVSISFAIPKSDTWGECADN